LWFLGFCQIVCGDSLEALVPVNRIEQGGNDEIENEEIYSSCRSTRWRSGRIIIVFRSPQALVDHAHDHRCAGRGYPIDPRPEFRHRALHLLTLLGGSEKS